MTLSTTDSRFSYDGDGSTTAFSYPRKVIEAAHLKVYLYDEDDDSMSLQTLNTHYTFAGSGLSNGIYASATITFLSAPGTDKKVIIFRDPALTQEQDFTSETNVLNALNRFADRVEMKLQRVDDRLDRAVVLPDGDYASGLTNAYAKNDWLGKVLYINASGNLEPQDNNASSSAVTATGSTTARSLADRFGEMVNVKDYGAVGDDSTNDATAFQAALTAALATYDSSMTGQGMTWNNRQKGVFIPPGDYYIGSGLTQASGNIIIYAIPNTVRIRLASGIYFLTSSASPQNVFVSGLAFVGGKGAFKFSTTGTNVSGNRHFEYCKFDAYTECAIGNLADDEPYWNIIHCEFKGVSTGGTIGIALGGYIDDSSIAHCDFTDNKYNIKLGPKLSGNVAITHCSFVQFTSGILSADIWLVPNATDAGATNSGWGISVTNNKFSNENLAVGDCRVLVASEGTGTDRLSKVHSTTFASSGAFVSGVSITDNRIAGVANSTAPFIKSYCGLLPFWSFADNDMDGGAHTYLCEMMGSITNEDAYFYQTWIVRLTTMQAAARPFSISVFNEPLGFVDDPYGLMQGDPMARPFPTTNDDAGFTSLASSDGAAGLLVTGGASESTVADHYAIGTRASQVTFSASGDGNYAYVGLSAVTADKPSYAVVWLKAHATQSVQRVTVDIFNTTTSVTALRRPGVKLTSGWVRHVFPFVAPDGASQSDWRIRIYADDYTVTTGDKALVGPVRVYHAPAPQHDGHVRTLESGLYDGGHVVLGAYHLWIDSNGDLRVKSSAPSSALDGALVSATKAAFCAHKNGTNQTGIASATWTKLTFGTESFDQGGYYDTTNSRWTPPAGIVRISAAIGANNTLATTAALNLAIYKNGSEVRRGATLPPGTFTNVGVTFTDQADGDDYYEVYVFQNTGGGTFDIAGGAVSSYFCGEMI